MSAGGLVGMFINWIIFSVVSSTLGYAVDIMIPIINNYPGISMDVLNTISQLHLMYLAGPFLYAIVLGFNYIVTSNSESNAEV